MGGLERVTRIAAGATLAFFVVVASLNAAFGVIFDSDHFADTLFLLGAAWRVHEGLVPVLDFGHFYGGVMAQGLAATMRVVGPGVAAIEVFGLVLACALTALCALMLVPRISSPGFMLLTLAIFVLMLTRFPLEGAEAITRPVSVHSYLYNRVALAAMIGVGLFIALPGGTRGDDAMRALVAGALAALVALVKPTFVVFAPAVLLALVVQARWAALGGAALGIALLFAALDPTLARLTGSLEYALAHVGDGQGVGSLLRKAVLIPFAQPLATVLALGSVLALLLAGGFTRMVAALLLVAAGGIGMAATMGGSGILGQLALPVAVMLAFAAAEAARAARLPVAPALSAGAIALSAALALPHALNLAATAAEGWSQRDARLVETGPYARYLSVPDTAPSAPDEPTQYALLADGIAALTEMGDAAQWGIVANNAISFEHALLARPVAGYPLWQRSSAPEFAPGRKIAPQADVAMLARNLPGAEFRRMVEAEVAEGLFVLCRTSELWEIYRRVGRPVTGCSS